MAWQNRQVLYWLLAKERGVCSVWKTKNKEPGGSFHEAMTKLQGLKKEVAENSAGFPNMNECNM